MYECLLKDNAAAEEKITDRMRQREKRILHKRCRYPLFLRTLFDSDIYSCCYSVILSRKHEFRLKRPISDPVCDHDEYECADDKSEVYLPAESDPGSVIHSAHGELDEGASRPEAVCDAVAVLICEYEYLLVDVQYLSERLQDRHDDNSLSASRNDEEVEQCHKYKDDQESKDRASIFKELRHTVHDRIHDACLIHKYYDRLGKSYRESSGEYSDGAFAEELTCLAWSDPEDDGEQDPHDHIDRRDLRE